MAIGVVGLLVFLFYLSAVPVEMALKIRTKPKAALGAGFAVFEGRYALKQAEKRINGEKKHLPWGKFSLDAEKLSSLRALKYLLRRLKIERISLTGSIGMQDAAATAMICGCFEAVRHGIGPMGWSGRIQLDIAPDFSGSGTALEFCGMVSARAGHIMLTALIGAVYWIRGRISQWRSIRLKIS